MTTQFAQPSASGLFLRPADLNGHLVLVTEVTEAFDRYDDLAGKDKLNVRFNYVDLDGDQQLVEDAISSHPGIALRLKPHVGKGSAVLGRIGQEPSKKAGFNPTWVLGEYQEGVDDVRASQWLTQRAQQQMQQPTPAAQAAPAAAPSMATHGHAPAPAPVAAPAPAGPKPITESIAATMRENGIAIPEGTVIVPG